ncbi:hypothetical protein CQA53_06150 [Helicobacter didelphidarum]|uniref:Uncharacterized protein n=1 Tax=Helicobacter didelphidarum TaxID=2040648 RepID=A0A3D8IKT7_9HELI|nr:hypothetical protein [Helicobacter didelphidarum]RDU65733.1 hypothetical protein CQA53_06150 [Helicobacter didelphidarum]
MKKQSSKLGIKEEFNKLSQPQQLNIYKNIIKVAGSSNTKVNKFVSIFKGFGRGVVVFSIGYIYITENKAKAIILNSATIGSGYYWEV